MTARTEHADLIFSGSVPKRSETRRLRIIFRHASSAAALKPQRPKKGEAPEARVLDCVPCAVLRGFREVQRLAEEGRKKATEGQVEVQLGQGWIMTAGGGSAGVVKGKGGKGDGKAAVPTVVVLRTKELGEGAQAAEPTGGTGKGTGLWPILAPEPSSCTDFSGVCACDRRARCRHCRLGRG